MLIILRHLNRPGVIQNHCFYGNVRVNFDFGGRKMKLVGWILFLLFTFCGYSFAFDYFVVDKAGAFLAADAQGYPNLYGTYKDVYGATIRRMTDLSVMTKPNYPARTSTVENSDGTLFVLNRRGGYPGCAWHIFTVADGIRRCDFSAWTYNSNRADDMFVWSPTEPKVAYFFSASHGYPGSPARFFRMTINTTTWTISAQLLYTFTPELLPTPPEGQSLNAVLNHDEGPASWDGRYWAFRMACTGDGSQNLTTIALLFDRDLNGFEQPGIKGWVVNKEPDRIAYCLGISPGGGYLFWRVKGMWVKAHPIASMIGEVQSTNFTTLNQYAVQAHYSLGYDDLGNEVLVAPGNWVYKYYRFNQSNMPGVVICPKDWWRGSDGYSAVHSVTCGVIPGPRSWVAIINTSGAVANECGYEGVTGAATITYVHLSATNQKVFRVAHERNEAVGYTLECFAGASRDGTKMYFDSNWCGTQLSQTFRAELPANWWNESVFSSSSPNPTTNIPPTTPAPKPPTSTPPSPPKGVKILTSP